MERPLENLSNHCLVYRCEIQSNRIDGIKSVDYALDVLGCLITGNFNNAIKVVHPHLAETSIYFKNRMTGETDLQGRVMAGGDSNSKYKPRVVFESNL